MCFFFSGKSTLVNVLRNLEDVRPFAGKRHNKFGSAPTGEWQTTMETLCYGCPEGHDLQYVQLWDTPGLGTNEHPSADYFEKKCLYAFDVLVIVTHETLGEYEYTLLENAKKWETSTVIVVTKAEVKVNAKIRQKYITRNPSLEQYKKVVEDMAIEARENVLNCLDGKGFHTIPVCILSAWEYRDFMMEQERVNKLSQQQTASLNLEARADEPLGQQISNQGVNNDILADNGAQQQEIVEHSSLAKLAVLGLGLIDLLDYLVGVAAERRL